MNARGLGTRLRTLRESATLTREGLAERSGVSVRTIAALELGTVGCPRVSTLGALADGLCLNDAGRAELVARARRELPELRSPALYELLPAPRELPPVPATLPGRLAVRDAAAAFLGGTDGAADGVGPRVWVASGPPGVGKTTLAVQIAHAVAPVFPDGHLFLALGGGGASSGTAPVEMALRRILVALGAHPAGLPHDVESLAARMRSRLAGARVLIVLDDAPDAVDLTPLLPGSGVSGVIVTARTAPTSLPAARHQGLGALGPEDAVGLLAAVAGSDRVALEPDAARRVVELCDGLPVAIKVAGSRLAARPDLTVGQVAQLLVDERTRLDLLSGAGTGVRASLASAYESLPEADRVTLLVLGDLGTGTGPTWAVAAALGVSLPRAILAVERLVDSGLVDSSGVGVEHSYRVPDLTRILAGERAARVPRVVRAQWWDRVLTRWRQLVRAAEQRLSIGTDEAADRTPPGPLPEELADLLEDPYRWLANSSELLQRHMACALSAARLDPDPR